MGELKNRVVEIIIENIVLCFVHASRKPDTSVSLRMNPEQGNVD